MSSQAAVRILEAGDIRAFRAGFAQVFAHLPQPKTDREAEIMLHSARTQAESVAFAKRAYSHRWLTERNLPSSLPDPLKPKAERLCPKVVTAVGIMSATTGPMTSLVRTAMQNAVLECYGDMPEGVAPNPVIVKQRMMHARDLEIHRLVGAIAPAS